MSQISRWPVHMVPLQEQSAELEVLPSVMRHGLYGSQIDEEFVHKDLGGVHTTLPHMQVTELAEDPSVFAQVVMGAVLHALSELSQ